MSDTTALLKINLRGLKSNLDKFVSYLKPNTKLMIMVKASAYGTGCVKIGQWLEKTGLVDYFGVAYVTEGVELRRDGNISLPIMVIITTDSEFETCRQFNLEPVIYSIYLLEKFIEYLDENNSNKCSQVHIKLDTGLHRLGINLDEIPSIINKLIANSHRIHVKSIYSHFSGSYSSEFDANTRHQADLFITNAERIEKSLNYSVLKHLCNSGGIIRHPEFHFDMVRLGLGLYGTWGIGSKAEFQKNVVSLFAPIIYLQYVNPGETVGYTHYQLNRRSLIGVLRIGYADGLRRHLNNSEGQAWIYGQRVRILNLSMDMTMIDLTEIDGQVKINDQVEIFGEHIPLEQMAHWCKATSFEFLLGFSQRVKRIYVEEDDD